MNEQLRFIVGSMQELCKSAIEKADGDVDTYIRLDEISEEISLLLFYLEHST